MDFSGSKSGMRHMRLSHAWVIFPSVALGVLAMIMDGVSPALWGQQIAAFFAFALLGLLRRSAQRIPSGVRLAVCLAALAATLLFPAVGGARRWLDLGIFHVNAAMLVIPSLLVLLGGRASVYPAVFIAAVVLCIQPDFSQLTAFSLGVLPLLWQGRRRMFWSAVVLLACLIRCASVPTALEPVAYCEGVLDMLGNLSPLMQAAGYLSLALIPGYFVYRFMRKKADAQLCLALYYTAAILFSLAGQYPVPFMGFGLSPIAGYYLADICGTSIADR